jgi:hypothetical protein
VCIVEVSQRALGDERCHPYLWPPCGMALKFTGRWFA